MAYKPIPERITLAQAAEVSGFSYWTLRRRIADGTLPAAKIRNGRGIRVLRSDVDALLRPIGGDPSAA